MPPEFDKYKCTMDDGNVAVVGNEQQQQQLDPPLAPAASSPTGMSPETPLDAAVADAANEHVMANQSKDEEWATPVVTRTIDGADTELFESSETQQQQQRGYHLRWSRLGKVVEVKDSSAGGLVGRSSISASFRATGETRKTILDNVSGYAAPGEVLACMGPSGAGKTTLMNVLSGRSVYQIGTISINGEKTTASSMKRLMSKVGYVKQADIFFGHLTVRDQLTYTALLRLPSDWPNAKKHGAVDHLIRLLRLTKVADSPIQMLSGGERKRVNIGTEIVTFPPVLLLDEPTSGLDSTSAVSLLRLLQTFARQQGKTVITSIHQPSSAVFRSFDRLIMLSEGRVVYFGSPIDSLTYLREQGLACPDGYNAADHWMDLLVIDNAVDEERHEQQQQQQQHAQCNDDNDEEVLEAGLRHRRRAEKKSLGASSAAPGATSSRKVLQDAWDNEAVAVEMDRALVVVDGKATARQQGTAVTNEAGDLELGSKYNTTWATQFYILTHRSLKNSRSAIFTPLNLIKSVALGAVAGLVWFQTDYTEQNVFDIRSLTFFSMTYWLFDAMFNALMAFPTERSVIMRERASATYHLSAYFLAKTTSDAPVRLTLPFLFMTVSYWLAGIDDRFWVFLATLACTLLSVLAGESFGLVVGASIPDPQRGMTVMLVCSLFLMLLGGFFVESVPAFVSWAKYLSPFKYAFDSSLQFIFNRDVPCDGSGGLEGLCPTTVEPGVNVYASAKDVQEYIGVQGSIGFNIGMLIVLIFIPRYVAYLFLRNSKAGDRS